VCVEMWASDGRNLSVDVVWCVKDRSEVRVGDIEGLWMC
jgi:hypothetical protein